GFFGLALRPDSDPHKIAALGAHMLAGMLILLLTVIRFFVRLSSSRPPAASIGHRLADRLAPVTHYAFYLLAGLMVAGVLAGALRLNLVAVVRGASDASLPSDLLGAPPLVAHGWFALTLAALIAMHLLAAIYHHWIRCDGLLGRMWFGRRRG